MDKNRKDLAMYRLNTAKQALRFANILLQNQDYKGAANRSYYCIFHAMRSILALDGVDFSKHAGVISYFRRQYIKTGVFDVELSDIIGEAFDIRSDSDYDDYYVISKEEVKQQIYNAGLFCKIITKYIEKQVNE